MASLGVGTELAKSDLRSAFRTIPVNRADFNLLGFTFEGKYYFDMCLPFGCRQSCSLYETFSSFLNWLVNKITGEQLSKHFLDDFIHFGPHTTGKCGKTLRTFKAVCRYLGVPVAEEKTVEPCTCLTFLGLEIDSVSQQVKVPPDNLGAWKQKLWGALFNPYFKLKELQSLLGF